MPYARHPRCPRGPDLYAGAREEVAQRAGLQILTARELVRAYPFDELRVAVDQGDLDVVAVQPLGEATGGVGSGVPGSQDDDAVLRDSLLCGVAFTP
ncbi:hypothetical protein [Microbispora bryophytorum]|uniref:hypothetical protein n=1 Tax=Microbispora bryophytorum TaxID=1460882 RepID=UPI0033F7E443